MRYAVLSMAAVFGLVLSDGAAKAQVVVGVRTPGIAIGVGVAPPLPVVVAPTPVIVAPPVVVAAPGPVVAVAPAAPVAVVAPAPVVSVGVAAPVVVGGVLVRPGYRYPFGYIRR